MENINAEQFRNAIFALFKETFEGSPVEASGSIYLDRRIGVFPTISTLNVENALLASSPDSAVIVSHIEHLRYYLEVLDEYLHGKEVKSDWSMAWKIKEVTQAELTEIKAKLQLEYEKVTKSFAEISDWNEDKMTSAIAIITHSAYHLGAVRQILKGISTAK
jgi:hypothetical protein